jgi:hypothetical protein
VATDVYNNDGSGSRRNRLSQEYGGSLGRFRAYDPRLASEMQVLNVASGFRELPFGQPPIIWLPRTPSRAIIPTVEPRPSMYSERVCATRTFRPWSLVAWASCGWFMGAKGPPVRSLGLDTQTHATPDRRFAQPLREVTAKTPGQEIMTLNAIKR